MATQLPLSLLKVFPSSEQTVAVDDSATIAHGLSYTPLFVVPVLVCQTAEHGYSVGDHAAVNFSTGNQGNSIRGMAIRWDDTNIYYKMADNGLAMVNASTGVQALLTAANWRVKFVAL